MEQQQDLGIKIGTKDEAKWTQVKKSAEAEIDAAEFAIKYHKSLLVLAETKIKEEQRKSKNDS